MRPLLVVLCCLWAGLAAAQDGPRSLTVSGTGSVAATPDMAVITLGVTQQGADPATAMDATSTATAAILRRMVELGIAAADIRTSDLSLSPVYDSRPAPDGVPRIVGYQAANMVTVRLRALDQLGPVLARALEDGANLLGGLSFGFADPAPLLTQARQAAVADARLRAETYAEAAGVSLGAVLRLSEATDPGPGPMMRMMEAAASVPVAAGQSEISATVQMVFALK